MVTLQEQLKHKFCNGVEIQNLYLISLAYINSSSHPTVNLLVLSLGEKVYVNMHIHALFENRLFKDPTPTVKSVILTMALCMFQV